MSPRRPRSVQVSRPAKPRSSGAAIRAAGGRRASGRSKGAHADALARRVQTLRSEIRRADHAYYVLDRPLISDEAYDRLYEELLRLESEHPELRAPDSPTQRVAGTPSPVFRTAHHAAPMLSLAATRERDEVERFVGRMRAAAGVDAAFVLQPKLDGLSIELVYEAGTLVRAVTRGDGVRGEDVTANVRTIRSVPLRLRASERDVPALLAIRGEVLMPIPAFERSNRQLLERGEEPFANPRNAAAGSVRQLDARVTATRPLDVVAYEILAVRGPSFDREQDVIAALEAWGLRTPSPLAEAATAAAILQYHEKCERARDTLDYEIDGVVIKLAGLAARRRLGATAHHPRWTLAYKFAPRASITAVTSIAVQVGRTGVLTPVALLRPVDVGGVTVARATLYNPAEVRRRDVRPGDQVRVQRAGDVIPEIVERVPGPKRRLRPFRMPARCPACGARVERRGPLVLCPNRYGCPAQLVGRLVHFARREAFDIPGIGPATARALVDAGLATEPADLFRLKEAQVANLPGFGPQSARKLVAAIRRRRPIELHRLLVALAIPGIGATTARVLARAWPSLDALRSAGEDLKELPAIGHDLAEHIAEIVRTGNLERLDELERELPGSLVELMSIEGLGPKRVRMLYDKLGIRSVRELSRAIDAGRLKGVRGIGPKTIEKMRRGLAVVATRTARFRLIDADQLVEPLLAYLRGCPAVESAEVAGSYRRRRETVGDIDVLVVSRRPATVMRHFTAYPEVARVEAAGRTRGTVVEAGLRISEYGVFRAGKGRRRGPCIAGRTEKEVFHAVGLPWIPPELREDRGEIDAARAGTLPTLIEAADIRGDLQMHSTWSDGNDSIEGMVAACAARGYAYMAITDHGRSLGITHGLGPRDVGRQAAEIAALRRRHRDIRILHGLEVDILRDGTLDLPDATLARLDLVIVSVHSALDMDRRRMTDRVIRAIRHPGVHILAHPTGRLIGRREPCELDIEAVLSAAAEAGVAVELNAQPDRLDLDDVCVRRARELGVPVAIDTDAHSAETLAFMRYGVDQARRGWLERKDVLNTRSAEEIEAWLQARRPRRARSAQPRRRASAA